MKIDLSDEYRATGKKTVKSGLVSIIILNWNRRDDLLETLYHVSQIEYEKIEVIVVDNGSSDGSIDAVRSNYPSVHLIALPINIGCEDGNNVGILNARGEYLLFLDNDADLAPSGLGQMVEAFEAEPSLGIIEPRIIRPADGKILNEPKYWPIRNTFTACVVAIRASVFREIGLRPGEFFLYSSEQDICLRAIDRGIVINHRSDIVGRHRESPLFRANKRFYRLATRNMLWLIWRHYPFCSAVYETTIMLSVQVIRSFRHRAFHFVLLGLFDGLLKFYPQALSKRVPLERYSEARVFPGFRCLVEIVRQKVQSS